jgi:hypothetical protein
MKDKPALIVVAFGIGLLIVLRILLLSVANLSLLFLGQPSDEPLVEFTAHIYQPAPTPGSDLELIEADARVTIPSSAREIYATVSGFRELDIWMRFDLPASDLDSFLRDAYCTTPLLPVQPQNHAPGDLEPDWWQPHQASNLEKCTGTDSLLYQRILVDRTNAPVFRVYVFSIVDGPTTPVPGPKNDG